jgi:hypothetical protein
MPKRKNVDKNEIMLTGKPGSIVRVGASPGREPLIVKIVSNWLTHWTSETEY